MKTVLNVLPLALSCFLLLVISCREKEESLPLPVEEPVPSGPSAELIVEDMALGAFYYMPHGESDTITFQDRFVPGRLFPEALRLEPGSKPRLVYPDGASEELPFALGAPLRVEIPLERSDQSSFTYYNDWFRQPMSINGPGAWYLVEAAFFAPRETYSEQEEEFYHEKKDEWADSDEGTLDGLRRWRILCSMGGEGGLAYGAPSVLPLEGIIAASADGTGFVALGADHSILYYRTATGLERSSSLDTPAPPPRTALAAPAVGRETWALVPPEEALTAMRTKTRELLRPEGDFEFLDVSFQTPWTRLPPRGALLVRMAGEEQRSVRIRLESDEDYLMILFDEEGQRLADNMGYEAEKTLSRTLPAGRVHWLALAFLHPAREPARLVVQETGGGKAKEQGEVF